ncbi:unnamed protein product [Prorocentrum cordatum]|uniref:Uncharacterized protein n=1 Tax=Prorocentrum cordatum TaxID=2364126 RepID=A0ABN9Y9F7_9DINO|nr:unnamed protein product [Polarella glacialis]
MIEVGPEDLRPLPRGKSWPSRAPGAPAPVAGCRAPHEPRGRPVHIGPRTRGSGKCHARGGTCRVLAPRTPRSAAAAGRAAAARRSSAEEGGRGAEGMGVPAAAAQWPTAYPRVGGRGGRAPEGRAGG